MIPITPTKRTPLLNGLETETAENAQQAQAQQAQAQQQAQQAQAQQAQAQQAQTHQNVHLQPMQLQSTPFTPTELRTLQANASSFNEQQPPEEQEVQQQQQEPVQRAQNPNHNRMLWLFQASTLTAAFMQNLNQIAQPYLRNTQSTTTLAIYHFVLICLTVVVYLIIVDILSKAGLLDR